MRNINTIQLLINEYATDDLEFPDQQIINRIFNYANFDSNVVIAETLELVNRENLANCGIFHYIGKNKDVKTFLNGM